MLSASWMSEVDATLKRTVTERSSASRYLRGIARSNSQLGFEPGVSVAVGSHQPRQEIRTAALGSPVPVADLPVPSASVALVHVLDPGSQGCGPDPDQLDRGPRGRRRAGARRHGLLTHPILSHPLASEVPV